MRGGKREGAGRKPSEPTKVIRVPESMIPEIMGLISRRRQSAGLVTEVKESKLVTEIKPAPLKPDPEIKAARLQLERLKGPEKRPLLNPLVLVITRQSWVLGFYLAAACIFLNIYMAKSKRLQRMSSDMIKSKRKEYTLSAPGGAFALCRHQSKLMPKKKNFKRFS